MNGTFINSILFIFFAASFAMLAGIVIGVLRTTEKIYRNSSWGGIVSTICETVLVFFEIIPVAGLVLILAYLTVNMPNEFLRILILSCGAGLVWSCNVGRVVANRLDYEFSKEYTSQLAMLGLSNIGDLTFKLIIFKHLKEIASSAITIMVYAIITDTSIGFMLNYNPELREAPIRYYSSSYGHYLSTLFSNPAMLILNVSGLVLIIVSLIRLTDWLERQGTEVNNEIVYNKITNSEDNAILRVKELSVRLGRKNSKGFSLILNKSSDFNVFPGDVVWLKGVSGSGKSLMFKSLVDYLPGGAKASGEIEMTSAMSNKREIEIIFQEPSLYLYPYLRLNALSVLATGKKWRELLGSDINEDIGKLESSYIESMSAGQKRIAFSNIVFARLDRKIQSSQSGGLVLCDEPDASLDKKNKDVLTEKLSVIAESGKFGIIYVSHDPSVIKSISGRTSRDIKLFECKAFDGGSVVTKDVFEDSSNSSEDSDRKIKFLPWSDNWKQILSVKNLVVMLSGDKNSHFRYCDKGAILPANRVVVLHGRNGSGKSTFLKGLSGFYPSIAKEMVVDSVNVKNMDLRARGRFISHFSDDTEKIFPLYVPIGKYLTKILNINGFSRDQFLEKAMEFDLPEDVLERYSMELSGGQRQKLVYLIARYVVKSPVVLLDEPFSRLDDLSETKIIDDLFADKRKTYLIISHRIDKLAMKGAIGLDIDTLLG